LEEWTSNQIYECLEVLAGLNWPNKAEFWNLVKGKVESRLLNEKGRLQTGAATILMPILDVVEPGMFPSFSDRIIDPISRLGAIPSLDLKSTKQFAGLYSEGKQLARLVDANLMNFVDMLEFAALGNLICGLPTGLVEGVLQAAKPIPNLNMAHLLGATVTRCQNQAVLKLVAKKSVLVNVSKASNSFDVANLLRHGVFLAGVEPKQMSSWPEEVFRQLTPEIVSHLTLAHLGSLTVQQLSAIPVDSLAVLAVNAPAAAKSTKLTLNHQQFQALVSKRQSLVPLRWLDHVILPSRSMNETFVDDTADNWEDSGDKPEPEPESEPEPEIEPVPSESMSAAERTNIIVIAVSVAFGVFILVCIAVCWYLGRCCCKGCQKPPQN